MPEMPSQNENICQGCGLHINDQYIFTVMPDMQWHEACLKCAECSCQLSESCFVLNSKTYCRQDYAKLVKKACDKCGLALKRSDLIMKSKDKLFHMECFKCTVCARKLTPGDEYCHQPNDDMLYCKEDALVASNGNKFFINTSQIYLATSTASRYQSSMMSITPETSSSASSSCSYSPSTTASSITDSPSNFSNTNNNSFHSMPSNTTTASAHFLNSNRFDSYHNKEDDSISDEDEQENNEDEDEDDENLIDEDDDDDDSLTDNDGSFNDSNLKVKRNKNKHRHTKSKNGQAFNNKKHYTSLSPDSMLLQVNHSYNGSGGHGNKPARIRTVLNEKQLQTLRACYGANPRPDALMKEQLVEMTGLNPRVIRVWFQNKRCKDKKKNMLVRPEHHSQHHNHLGNQPSQNQLNHHLTISNSFHSSTNNNQHLMFEHCF